VLETIGGLVRATLEGFEEGLPQPQGGAAT